MRTTWDAAAASDRVEHYVGDPATARSEVESVFSRLGADPRQGICVEVGCGFGRMTGVLAERFDRVIALDLSPKMLELARGAVEGARRAGDGGRPRPGHAAAGLPRLPADRAGARTSAHDRRPARRGT